MGRFSPWAASRAALFNSELFAGAQGPETLGGHPVLVGQGSSQHSGTMRVKSPFLERLHLDNEHFLLTGRSILLVREFFDAIDVRRQQSLDDVMFVAFMKEVTDLSEVSCTRM